MKMTNKYFSKIPFTSSNIPFRTDRTVEDDVSNAQPCKQEELNSLEKRFGEHASNCGSLNHVSMSSRPDA